MKLNENDKTEIIVIGADLSMKLNSSGLVNQPPAEAKGVGVITDSDLNLSKLTDCQYDCIFPPAKV